MIGNARPKEVSQICPPSGFSLIICMSTDIKKYLHESVDRADDSLLQSVYDLFRAHEGEDWWHTLPPDAQASFHRGMEDLKAGRFNKAEDVMAKVKEEFIRK